MKVLFIISSLIFLDFGYFYVFVFLIFVGKKAKEAVEKARVELADLFHVTPREVFFTSGGTEVILFICRKNNE